jgi:hypothetical protein
MVDLQSALAVDYTCVLDVQFENAANSVLQRLAFSMCSKICFLYALCGTALHTVLHAALRAFLCYVFSVRFLCSSKPHT